MRGTALILLATLMLVAFGCKNRGNVRNGRVQEDMTTEKLLKKNRQSAIDFELLAIRGKADYEDVAANNSISFSYRVNIAKDSLIWASISKFGFPLATILADPDTIRIRRMDTKSVNICDYQILTKLAGMDIDFAMLQNIFTGEPVLPEKGLSLRKGAEKSYILSGIQSHFNVDWHFEPTNHKLARMDLEDAALGMKSSVLYGNFLEVESQLVPSEVALNVDSPKQVKINMQHGKISINDPGTTFTFRIPDSYEITGCKL